jgi:hypothetical protein
MQLSTERPRDSPFREFRGANRDFRKSQIVDRTPGSIVT